MHIIFCFIYEYGFKQNDLLNQNIDTKILIQSEIVETKEPIDLSSRRIDRYIDKYINEQIDR